MAPRLLLLPLAAMGLLLTACTSAPPGPVSGPTSQAVSPSVSPSAQPSATASATPSASPAPSATTPSAAAAGCRNDAAGIPAGADTATIADIDGDGRPDREFYADGAHPSFGIRTAAGGTYLLYDGLAGPATHSGWMTNLDAPGSPIIVLDDDRSANLFGFRDCRFLTIRNRQGQPYTFGLNGFSSAGTGVACNNRNGGVQLEGVLAVERPDGRYDIRWTHIDLTVDGTTETATNGTTEVRYSDLAASNPLVAAAKGSSCNAVPIVHTHGQ